VRAQPWSRVVGNPGFSTPPPAGGLRPHAGVGATPGSPRPRPREGLALTQR